ncbi:MAG TPA: CooT family nickel-binding protein [Candidatus Methanoperedenaceae archaeon]|nr:CooT family nickel-binding protein [Candidatus Methanoperedenaceae archaeon]
MCELRVFMENGNREQIMDDVVRIKVNGGSITLVTLLGETRQVSGAIKEIDITKQEAVLKRK